MYQYSFANVDLLLRIPNANRVYVDVPVKGFATGENLINVTRKAPIAATQFGAYGHMVVSLQRIRAGDLTFPVLMNAPENKVLQDYANHMQEQADANGALILPIQATLTDNMGLDEAKMTNGVILAMPTMSRGQTMNIVTWVITFETVVFKRENGGDIDTLGLSL